MIVYDLAIAIAIGGFNIGKRRDIGFVVAADLDWLDLVLLFCFIRDLVRYF